MNHLFEFHTDAESDLRGIIRYSRKTWGLAQANIYKAKLNRCMEALANGSGLYKSFTAGSFELRMGFYEHHYIFMLPRKNAPALIVAILHERMNIIERIAVRLKADRL